MWCKKRDTCAGSWSPWTRADDQCNSITPRHCSRGPPLTSQKLPQKAWAGNDTS
jgi:hypothetical protein